MIVRIPTDVDLDLVFLFLVLGLIFGPPLIYSYLLNELLTGIVFSIVLIIFMLTFAFLFQRNFHRLTGITSWTAPKKFVHDSRKDRAEDEDEIDKLLREVDKLREKLTTMQKVRDSMKSEFKSASDDYDRILKEQAKLEKKLESEDGNKKMD